MISVLKKYNFKLWHFDLIVVLLLLLLPYLIFGGKSFIGGDDSRLYYLYPELFLKNLNLSAWFNFSATGSYNPNFFLIPILGVAYVLKLVLVSGTIVGCLFFSLPLILGYYYFQKLSRSFMRSEEPARIEIKIGALVYAFSPILLAGLLSHFLYAIWLIPAIPGLYYYLNEYIKSGRYSLVLKACLLSIFLSLAIYSFPWLFGFLIPVLLAYGFMVLVRHVKTGVKKIYRIIVFGLAVFLVQSFWLIPFLYSFLPQKGTSYLAATLSKETADTFATTVLATSRGTILYPMLNLFHRQIAIDFNWPLADVYKNYYDKILIFSFIYIIIIGVGFCFQRKVLSKKEQSNYIFILFALLISLFLFTVNIGPLKDIYLTFGKIPGFAMFRNGYDKFAPGYVLFYALLITYSLVVIARSADKDLIPRKLKLSINTLLILTVIVNFIPAKTIINRKLWKTDNIGTTIKLPDEYLDFMEEVGSVVPRTKNILSLPYGIALYTTVKDTNSDNVFTGRSPVQIFSGIHDFSGNLSFSSQIGKEFEDYIQSRDYKKLKDFLATYNIHFILETKNIPSQVKKSYLFSEPILAAQDDVFRENMFGRIVRTSSDNNYVLYEVKDQVSESGLFSTSVQHFELINGNNEDKNIKKLRSLYSPARPIALTEEKIPQAIKVWNLDLENNYVPKGNYFLHKSKEDLRLLKVENNSLFLDDKINIEVDDNEVPNGSKVEVSSFTEKMIIEDSGRYYDFRDLSEGYYTVDPSRTIISYSPEIDNMLDEPSVIADKWSNGDCYRYDDFGEQEIQSVSDPGGDILKIATNDEHNGCVWNEFSFEKDHVYKVQFDYQTVSEELAVVITDSEAAVAKKMELKTKNLNGWTSYKGYYTPKKDEKGLFMLYSGRSKNGSASQYRNIKITKFQKELVIPMNSTGVRSSSAINVNINDDKNIINFKPQFLDQTKYVEDFNSWSRANCNAFDNRRDSSEFIMEEGAITLSATNFHNACINKSIPINYNDVYRVELKYEKKTINPIQLYIDFGKDYGHQVVKLGDSGSVTKDIEPPVGASSMMLVLYSGQSKAKSTMKYSEVKLSSYSRIYTDNAIVEDKKFEEPPLVSNIIKRDNHFYEVRVSNINSNFMLSMNDSFHGGWELTELNSRQKIKKHIPINGYANGWYVDINEICQKITCTKNSSGMYELNFEVKFEPQKWFYIGTIVTASSLGVIVLVSIVDTFIKRKKKSAVYRVSDIA